MDTYITSLCVKKLYVSWITPFCPRLENKDPTDEKRTENKRYRNILFCCNRILLWAIIVMRIRTHRIQAFISK